jgi:hypothetical protein
MLLGFRLYSFPSFFKSAGREYESAARPARVSFQWVFPSAAAILLRPYKAAAAAAIHIVYSIV